MIEDMTVHISGWQPGVGVYMRLESLRIASDVAGESGSGERPRPPDASHRRRNVAAGVQPNRLCFALLIVQIIAVREEFPYTVR
jgi:hypothetical protein